MLVNVLITIGEWWIWWISKAVWLKFLNHTFCYLLVGLLYKLVNMKRFFPLAGFSVKELSAFRNHLQMAFQIHHIHHFLEPQL